MNPTKNIKKSRRFGFTLLQLLIVVSLIVILVMAVAIEFLEPAQAFR